MQMELQLKVCFEVRVAWPSHHGLHVTSRQGNGDSAIRSTPAPGVNAGLGQLVAVFLWLLIRDVGQEAQCDRVPLLWQQQQQEAQADDAGGCEAHHAEDHLVFQNIHSYKGRQRRRNTSKSELITSSRNTAGQSGCKKMSVDKHGLLSVSNLLILFVLVLFTQGQGLSPSVNQLRRRPWQPHPQQENSSSDWSRGWLIKLSRKCEKANRDNLISLPKDLRWWNVCHLQCVEGRYHVKDHTCIARNTKQCSYGDENGVCQHHTNMDQDVEDWRNMEDSKNIHNYLYDRQSVIDALLIDTWKGNDLFRSSGGLFVHAHPATVLPGRTCTPTAVTTASPSAPPW